MTSTSIDVPSDVLPAADAFTAGTRTVSVAITRSATTSRSPRSAATCALAPVSALGGAITSAMRRYRVKDFAAFYLARIIGVELPWQQDLAKRDAAIANLRAKL